MDVVIYHNPGCGTSRNALALIRHAGIEPHVIDYQTCPPSRELLAEMIERWNDTDRQDDEEQRTTAERASTGWRVAA